MLVSCLKQLQQKTYIAIKQAIKLAFDKGKCL